MIKITFDTNCLINILDYKSPSATSVDELSEIIRYGFEGDVNIAITTRAETDFETDKDDERKTELLKRIKIFPVIGTVFRWDTSKLDSGDVLTGEEHDKLEEELKRIVFPNLQTTDKHYQNKINDIDHIIGHKINKRDIFVTDDKEIIKKAETLKSSLGLVVMDPKKCLEYINLNANQAVLVEEYYEKLKEYKQFLLDVVEGKNYADKQAEYIAIREWLLRKYPLVKDGLLRFKWQMLAVPIGGQMVFDQTNILGIQRINERIQELTIESDLKKQIDFFTGVRSDHDYIRYHTTVGDVQDKINEAFQDILDIVVAYSGYLERTF